MQNLRVYKFDNYYKIITLSRHSSDLYKENVLCEQNTSKLLNNIIRAKTNISNYIQCNNFYFFVTITINSEHDRYNLDYLRTTVNNKIRSLRKTFHKDFLFLFVPEEHKKGGYHLHGVLSKDFEQFVYINENGYKSLNIFDYLGFTNVSVIKDKERLSSYIVKYVSKQFAGREVGRHLYFACHGLQKPKLIYNVDLQDFNLEDLKKFDYYNDYCAVKKETNITNVTNLILPLTIKY